MGVAVMFKFLIHFKLFSAWYETGIEVYLILFLFMRGVRASGIPSILVGKWSPSLHGAGMTEPGLCVPGLPPLGAGRWREAELLVTHTWNIILPHGVQGDEKCWEIYPSWGDPANFGWKLEWEQEIYFWAKLLRMKTRRHAQLVERWGRGSWLKCQGLSLFLSAFYNFSGVNVLNLLYDLKTISRNFNYF